MKKAGSSFGEVFVVPKKDTVSVTDLDAATRQLYAHDWRIQDIIITVVPDLDIECHLKGLQTEQA